MENPNGVIKKLLFVINRLDPNKYFYRLQTTQYYNANKDKMSKKFTLCTRQIEYKYVLENNKVVIIDRSLKENFEFYNYIELIVKLAEDYKAFKMQKGCVKRWKMKK